MGGAVRWVGASELACACQDENIWAAAIFFSLEHVGAALCRHEANRAEKENGKRMKKGRHRVENALHQLKRRLREQQGQEHGQRQKMLRVKEEAHPHRRILEGGEAEVDDEEMLEKETAAAALLESLPARARPPTRHRAHQRVTVIRGRGDSRRENCQVAEGKRLS